MKKTNKHKVRDIGPDWAGPRSQTNPAVMIGLGLSQKDPAVMIGLGLSQKDLAVMTGLGLSSKQLKHMKPNNDN